MRAVDLGSVKAMQICTSHGWESSYGEWDGVQVKNTRIAARRAYQAGGIADPRADIGIIEVHDCFSITELATMEDLGLSDDDRAVFDFLSGRYDRDGAGPTQVDGGLICFGHPVDASGLRMAYEVYTQLLWRAGARQLGDADCGLTHNLGGQPANSASTVSVLGRLEQGA